MNLDSKIPEGPLADKWDNHRFSSKLVNPANKRKYKIIVVGSGLAGGSAAATLGELGYNVDCFCYQDSPRRAHSIAAQGGINAAKNYQNDGDSIHRLFYDTVKGGDFRSREANVYRLAQVSTNIIDQCVAQGVPFAREYGGLLANRSFGGAQVSRTFYARGQTGQQLLLGAYSALSRQISAGQVKMHTREESLISLLWMDTPKESLPVILPLEKPRHGPRMRYFCARVDMVMFIISRPMQLAVMLQPPFVHIVAVRVLRIHVLLKFTQLAFRWQEIINRNSP